MLEVIATESTLISTVHNNNNGMCHILGYQPASNYLVQKIVTYPQLYDSEYEVDLEKDWTGVDKHFKPIPLP